IGFKDGGKTMFLLITDGRQPATALGTSLTQTAQMLKDLGADTGLNLDGGGSTTLIARPLGTTTATVRNTPSDRQERAHPTGTALLVTPGSGKPEKLIRPQDARVFPGLHAPLTVRAVDDHDVAVDPGSVSWTGANDGVVKGPDSGDVDVKATAGSAEGTAKV